MDFSWLTITFVDIGLLSIGGLALWLQKRRTDRLLEQAAQQHSELQAAHNTLKEDSDRLLKAAGQRYSELQATYDTLKADSNQQYRDLQSASDRRYAELQAEYLTLQEGYKSLQEENEALRKIVTNLTLAVEALQTDNKTLQSKVENLTGRYEELHEKVDPILEGLIHKFLRGDDEL